MANMFFPDRRRNIVRESKCISLKLDLKRKTSRRIDDSALSNVCLGQNRSFKIVADIGVERKMETVWLVAVGT